MQFKESASKCAFDSSGREECLCTHALRKISKAILPPGAHVSDDNLLKVLKAKTGCATGKCMLKSPLVKKKLGKQAEEIHKMHYKVEGPSDDSSWLTNSQIDNILDQAHLEFAKKKFYHIPYQMIDFDENPIHGNEDADMKCLCLADKYNEGFRTFGVVINTDTSKGRGIHWFSVYADFTQEPFTIEYYNSAGDSPKSSVHEWMERQAKSVTTQLKKPTKIIIHRIHHQSDGYNCGVYALYYILSRLSGVSPKWFQQNNISSSKMNAFRKYLYTHW